MELFTTRPADQPLFLDFSPPFAGNVYDGLQEGAQTYFTYIDTQLSSNWDGFYDPQSGVGSYSASLCVFVCVCVCVCVCAGVVFAPLRSASLKH